MKLWTIRNIATAAAYRFMRKTPPWDRCIMGGPVHPRLHCPRKAVGDSLWCDKHSGGQQ